MMQYLNVLHARRYTPFNQSIGWHSHRGVVVGSGAVRVVASAVCTMQASGTHIGANCTAVHSKSMHAALHSSLKHPRHQHCHQQQHKTLDGRCLPLCCSTPPHHSNTSVASTSGRQHHRHSNTGRRPRSSSSSSQPLVALTEPLSTLDVDTELWEVLDLCSDEELECIYNILHASSPFSPVVKSIVREDEPPLLQLRGRSSIMHKVRVTLSLVVTLSQLHLSVSLVITLCDHWL